MEAQKGSSLFHRQPCWQTWELQYSNRNQIEEKSAVQQFWSSSEYSRSDFLLFHSVWELVPELRRDIVELASTRTIIVDDDYALGLEGRKPYLPQANIIHVGIGPNERIDLRISLRKETVEKR